MALTFIAERSVDNNVTRASKIDYLTPSLHVPSRMIFSTSGIATFICAINCTIDEMEMSYVSITLYFFSVVALILTSPLGGAAFFGHFFKKLKKKFGLPTGFYPPDKCFFVAVLLVGCAQLCVFSALLTP
jgi:hypothetical protein